MTLPIEAVLANAILGSFCPHCNRRLDSFWYHNNGRNRMYEIHAGLPNLEFVGSPWKPDNEYYFWCDYCGSNFKNQELLALLKMIDPEVRDFGGCQSINSLLPLRAD